jgi:DNA-binding beta-propeller fold protein YncE
MAQQEVLPKLDYKPVPDFLQLPSGWNLGETSGVAVGPKGNIYVFHRGAHPLLEFDSKGKFLRSLCEEGVFTFAHAVRIDRENNIWTVDVYGNMVFKINQEGRILMVLGRKGQAGMNQNRFNYPADVAVAPSGDFYVADGYRNSRVVKYNRDGKFLLEWGKKGTGPGEFNVVHTIVLDDQGRVYVGDRENRRVQIFDSNGKFLQQWTHVGSPWGLDITPDRKHILLADGYNNRILLLNLEGQIQGALGNFGHSASEFIHAHAIAAAANGDIYVAEAENWRIQKFVKR